MVESLGASSGNITIEAMQRVQEAEVQELAAEQETSKEAFMADKADDPTSALLRNSKKLPERPPKTRRAEKVMEMKSAFLRKENADDFAQDFCNSPRNKDFQLPPDKLAGLLKKLVGLQKDVTLNPDADPTTIREEIIRTLREGFQDPAPSQVNRVFEFLLEGTQGDVREKIAQAHESYVFINQATIESEERLIKLANDLVQTRQAGSIASALDQVKQKEEELELTATGHIARTLNEIHNIIHNPQDVPTKLRSYRERGWGAEEIREDAQAILRYVGDRLTRRR
jgi:hypothetical protein